MPSLNTGIEKENVNVNGVLTFSVALNSDLDLVWNETTENALAWVGCQFRNGSLMRLIYSKKFILHLTCF